MSKDSERQEGIPSRWFLKLFTRLNVLVYRLSGGRLMNEFSGMPIVLVAITGAKSGRTRTIPLMHVPHEGGFLLVASQGGAPRHPLWYHNLVANPDVKITYNGQTRPMRVREVSGEERARLWPVCCRYYPPYRDYQARTEREIPVFLCE